MQQGPAHDRSSRIRIKHPPAVRGRIGCTSEGLPWRANPDGSGLVRLTISAVLLRPSIPPRSVVSRSDVRPFRTALAARIALPPSADHTSDRPTAHVRGLTGVSAPEATSMRTSRSASETILNTDRIRLHANHKIGGSAIEHRPTSLFSVAYPDGSEKPKLAGLR